MKMTKEEAIAILQAEYDYCKSGYDLKADPEEECLETTKYLRALHVAISALRPITRERVEQIRSRWVPLNNTQEHFCESCGVAFNLYSYCKNDYQFCPACGAPMTDEAVDMVMERLNKMEEMKK